MEDLLLGIDLGTTGTKTALHNLQAVLSGQAPRYSVMTQEDCP
jgi:sugar (pentulose or hexulose) kinase